MAKPQRPKDIDSYISQFPAEVQEVLKKVRATIRKTAPEAKETISYMMPAFMQHGILVYFAGWKTATGGTAICRRVDYPRRSETAGGIRWLVSIRPCK